MKIKGTQCEEKRCVEGIKCVVEFRCVKREATDLWKALPPEREDLSVSLTLMHATYSNVRAQRNDPIKHTIFAATREQRNNTMPASSPTLSITEDTC